MASTTNTERHIFFLGVTQYPFPLSETHLKKFRGLERLGEMHVVGWSQTRRFIRFRQHATFYLVPRIRPVLLRYALFLGVAVVVGAWIATRDAKNILIAQSPYEGLIALLVRLVVKLKGGKAVVIVEVHQDLEEASVLYQGSGLRELWKRTFEKLARMSLRRCDVIRVVSGFTMRQAHSIAPGKPLVRFAAFTDIKCFTEPEPEEQVPSISGYVLFVGLLIPRKGVEYLLHAFQKVVSKHPSASLVIIGNGNREASLKRLCRELRLEDHVLFRDSMPQRSVASWMRRARCLVLASLSEAFGLVVVEAMASGCPVLGSAVGGIQELVVDGVNGFLVPATDVETLADRMLYLLENQAVAAEMGSRGRTMVDKMYSAEGYFRGYQELVELADAFPSGALVD